MKRSLPILLLATTTLLSACGFHMRGTGAGGGFALDELSMHSNRPYSVLTRDVQEMLRDNGVKIVQVAEYKLVLGELETVRRTTSYTADTRAAEYELSASLPFELRNQQGQVLYRDTLETSKTQVNDKSNLAGTSEESRKIREEIQAELIQQLSLRLRQLSPERLQQLSASAAAAQ